MCVIYAAANLGQFTDAKREQLIDRVAEYALPQHKGEGATEGHLKLEGLDQVTTTNPSPYPSPTYHPPIPYPSLTHHLPTHPGAASIRFD
jgi:hypothetical protein